MIGTGSCNGTFGELVQGVLDERPFLITLPIGQLTSQAMFIRQSAPGIVGSRFHTKAAAACQKLLDRFGIEEGGYLHIHSNIQAGKGLASSSADIVAAIRAAAKSFHLHVTADMISAIASEIEPTDGVMYDGVVAYDYINGRLLEYFGTMPPFVLAGIDTGGTVDTVSFNRRTKQYSRQDRCMLEEAYELVRTGVQKEDVSLIGKGASISARINQAILPNPHFHVFQELADEYGGGVVTAHSGTVIALLLPLHHPRVQEVVSRIAHIADVEQHLYYFSNGGNTDENAVGDFFNIKHNKEEAT